ncbi:Uncharacterized protein APZ42_030353 [Daphnia magna]|uniref:Uncharacterized protein n=1 Tax=Daphnia magna TaxID=35525 RepID=A0A164NUG2_9CRUS|nr:Uncharacterized protein APZ42_030353 [Daphnia magna]
MHNIYTTCHGLDADGRTIGGNIKVLVDPPVQAADWGTLGARLTAKNVLNFLQVAVGGTSNARKFWKFVNQCGLTQMECPWPADVGVLSAMYSRMTAGMDRQAFTELFNHMAGQAAIDVLGF